MEMGSEPRQSGCRVQVHHCAILVVAVLPVSGLPVHSASLQSIFCVPGTVLGKGDTVMSRLDKDPAVTKVTF